MPTEEKRNELTVLETGRRDHEARQNLDELKLAWTELWREEEDAGFIKYVPIINSFLLIVAILVSIFVR